MVQTGKIAEGLALWTTLSIRKKKAVCEREYTGMISLLTKEFH